MITESLTARMSILRAALAMIRTGDLKSAWSLDGRITVLTGAEANKKVTISKISELDSIYT